MAEQTRIKEIDLGTGGAQTIADTDHFSTYILTGSGTLVSSASLTITGTSALPLSITVIYKGTYALNGNDITLFGTALTQEQATGGSTVVLCTKAAGGSWNYEFLDSSSIEPKNVDGVLVTTLNGSGGTVTLVPNVDYQTQVLEGTAPLTGSYVYQGTGTQNGQKFRVIYNGTMAATGGNITIFGLQLTDEQILNGGVTVDAEYNGSSWDTSASSSPFTSNRVDMIPLELSFETGEQIVNIVPMGYKGYLFQISYQVIVDIAGTDNATIDIDIAGTPVGNYPTITIGAGTFAGTGTLNIITTPNLFNTGDYINLTCAKTTPGGKVRFILYVGR